MTFTIDTDNNITAHAAAPAAQDNLVVFASQKERSKATTEWPASRLVEIWNSFTGTSGYDTLKPVKKFTDCKAATTRIWAAIQNLGEEVLRTSIREAEAKLKAARTAATPVPRAATKPAKKAKATKVAAGAPTPAPDASTPRVPREFSKQVIVRDMLIRTGGATLQEIVDATGWQKHIVRGFISTLPKKTGIAITSTRRESDKARVYEAAR
jgi:Protein of unknown function (DUF3489)